MGRPRKKKGSVSGKVRTGPIEETAVTSVDDEITPGELEAYERETWREDKLWELSAGFTVVEKGRNGAIYYRRSDAVVEFTWEFAGSPTLDILIWEDTASMKWIDVHTLNCNPVAPKDRSSIKKDLIDFLAQRGKSFSLDNKSYRNRRPIVHGASPKKRQTSTNGGR
jgi:hypothetical protein